MYALLFLLLTGSALAVHPPEDDQIASENKANSVRPPASDFFPSMPVRTSAQDKDKDVLSAEDVKKIEGKKDQEVVVKGTVVEVFLPRSGNLAILNFGKDNKKCFKAVIFKADFEKFNGGAEGIKKKYTGKAVIVEGKVSIFQNLPQIAIKTPSQIKIN